jgi:hypothetical protein
MAPPENAFARSSFESVTRSHVTSRSWSLSKVRSGGNGAQHVAALKRLHCCDSVLFILAARFLFLALVLFSLISSGCLSRPAMTRQTFALESPSTNLARVAKGDGVLAIRTCEVSPLFASQSLVYRTGPELYVHDPYAGLIVPPGRALEIPVRAYLRNCGAFRDVAEPGSLLQPDRFAEVNVHELYGDFRTPGQSAAVLTMRFTFFRAVGNGQPGVFFDKECSRRIPLKENTAAQLVTGWNQALAEIMAEISAELLGRKS